MEQTFQKLIQKHPLLTDRETLRADHKSFMDSQPSFSQIHERLQLMGEKMEALDGLFSRHPQLNNLPNAVHLRYEIHSEIMALTEAYEQTK